MEKLEECHKVLPKHFYVEEIRDPLIIRFVILSTSKSDSKFGEPFFYRFVSKFQCFPLTSLLSDTFSLEHLNYYNIQGKKCYTFLWIHLHLILLTSACNLRSFPYLSGTIALVPCTPAEQAVAAKTSGEQITPSEAAILVITRILLGARV